MPVMTHQRDSACFIIDDSSARSPFFIPCTAHSLNLLLLFDVIHIIYTIFSASAERWTILLKYVSDITLKPMSDTRWESRVESITISILFISKHFYCVKNIINSSNNYCWC